MVKKTSLSERATDEKHPARHIRKMHIFGKHADYIQLESGQVIDDEFLDEFCAINRKAYDKYTKKFATSGKAEQIRNWYTRIQKTKEAIKNIRKDPVYTTEVKRKKIKHCLDIIQNDKDSIFKMIEYLEFRSERDNELFAQMGRMK